MLKRTMLVGGAVLLALLFQSTPTSVSAPIMHAIERPPVEILLSAAPSIGGTVIELDVPAETLPGGRVPVIDRPGAENWMRGGKP